MADTVGARSKERRKHVRRGEGLKASVAYGGGRTTRLRAETVGGVSMREQWGQEYSPQSPILSGAQFRIYGRSMTEPEVIRAGIIRSRNVNMAGLRSERVPLGAPGKLATDPVVPWTLNEDED